MISVSLQFTIVFISIFHQFCNTQIQMNESEVILHMKYLKEPEEVCPDCPACPILSATSQEQTHIEVSNEKEYWKSIIAE